MARVYKTFFVFFEYQDYLAFRRFGLKEPQVLTAATAAFITTADDRPLDIRILGAGKALRTDA